MREEDHRLVWLGLGVYALTWLVGSALLSLVWGLAAGIWSALAGLSALAVVGLLAQPLRLFGTLWIRVTRTVNLSEIVGSTAPPSTFRRFVARDVSIEPQDGQIAFDGIALKHPKGSTLTVTPKTDVKPGLNVQTRDQGRGRRHPNRQNRHRCAPQTTARPLLGALVGLSRQRVGSQGPSGQPLPRAGRQATDGAHP